MEDGTDVVWMTDPTTRQILELFRLSRRSPIYAPIRRRARHDQALIFGVRDVRRLVRVLTMLGGRVSQKFEQGGVRFDFLRDPDGTRIELLSWAEGTPHARRLPPLVDLARPAPARPGPRRPTPRRSGRRRAPSGNRVSPRSRPRSNRGRAPVSTRYPGPR